MKRITLTGLTLAISAVGAFAQSSVDEITAQLAAEGYSDISVEIKDGTIEVEGYRAGQERELVFDAATWEILSDESHADLEADDDDGDSDDADDADENEADDHDDDADESDDDEDDDEDEDGDDD